MPSDWRLRAIKRRDERHTRADVRSPSGSKKDTKRWCRGVVGREHKPECRPYSDPPTPYSAAWRLLVCSTCGRHLDWWMPVAWSKPAEKPAWVVE